MRRNRRAKRESSAAASIVPEVLPKGWTSVALNSGLVVDVQPGFASGVHSRDESGIAHLRPMNINSDGQIDLGNVKFVTQRLAAEKGKWLRRGDVVFNNTNSPELVGKTAYYDRDEPLAFSNHMTRLEVRTDGLDPRYLAHALHANWMTGDFLARCNQHVSQASIGRESLLATRIPLPPLPVQRQIADTLDALTRKIRIARKRLVSISPIITLLKGSLLEFACTGRLTETWRRGAASRWQPHVLGDLLLEKPRNGTSPRGVSKPTSVKSLTLTATTSGRFLPQHFKYLDINIPHDSHLWLKNGDVLVQRSNTLEYVGVSAVYDGEDNAFVYPDLMMKLRPKPGVNSTFLWCALSTHGARNFMRARATGTAGSMPKINQATVMAVPIQLPPADEQEEIAKRVLQLLTAIDLVEHRLSSSTARADRMTEAAYLMAFSGQLVNQGSSDSKVNDIQVESGDQLVARIKSQPVLRRRREGDAFLKADTDHPRALSMKTLNEIGKTHLSNILNKARKRMSPEDLLKASELNVDDFYTQLKREVDAKRVKESRKGKAEVLLEAAR